MRLGADDGLISVLTLEPLRKTTRISRVMMCALMFWAACALCYWNTRFIYVELVFWGSAIVLGCAVVLLLFCCFKEGGLHKPVMVFAMVILLGCSSGAAGSYNHHLQKEGLGLEKNSLTVSALLFVAEDSKTNSYGSTTTCYLWSEKTGLIKVSVQGGSDCSLYFGQMVDGDIALSELADSRFDSAWQDGIIGKAKIITQTSADSWISPFARLRASFIQAIQDLGFDQQLSGLFLALSSGYRGGLRDSSLYRDFQIAGLAHLVAVSGAHLSLVISLVGAMLGRSKLARKSRIGICMGSLALFLVLCAFPLSAIRAAFMVVLATLSYFAKRRSAAQNALGLCIVLFVGIDPAVALSESFTLSALSTAGIIVLAPWLSQVLRKGPLETHNTMRETLALTFSANIATMPLCAALFAQVSLVSPLSNLVAAVLFVPLCGFCVCSQAVYCLMGTLPYGLIDVGMALCRIMAWVVARLAQIPCAAIPCNQSLVGGLATSFVVVFLLVAWQKWALYEVIAQKIKGISLGVFICVMACMVVLCALYAALFPADDDVALIALDVGQGDSLLIRDGDSCVLVDTGNQEVKLKQQLSAEGVYHLEGVFITHPDDDHCGCLEQLLRLVQVDAVYVASDLLSCSCWKCRDLRQTVNEADVPLKGVQMGDAFLLDRTAIKVIWPRSFQDEGGNQDSLCLQLSVDVNGDQCFDYKALLVGDAESETLEEMASLKLLADVDVFKVGHHGSKNSCSEKVLSIIDPEIALLSVGSDNRYGHPTATALKALEAQGTRWYRTDQEGRIRCYFRIQGISVSAER